MGFPHSSVPLHVATQVAASGDTVLAAAVTGKRIRLVALSLDALEDSTDVYLHDGTTSYIGSAAHPMTLDPTGVEGPSGRQWNENSGGHFDTGSGLPLTINASSANAVNVLATYMLV